MSASCSDLLIPKDIARGTNLRVTGFLSSEETLMLRWLVRIGALFVAYKFGEEVGRAQARVDLRAPLDYERLPADRQRDDFGIEPF
ncbi:hypothetical protein EB235_10990 [Mesorhizobium loti R88b]|uniref:Uncharacterized protein n=2 Tax=Rhizobium loti TaxID=381 RepID=A0A6M7WHR7_RHILI|nr:hypothetical protein EB235_10990 [Mesorhizobium loti R88b]